MATKAWGTYSGRAVDGHGGPSLQADLRDEPPVVAQELAGLLGLPGGDLGDGRAIDAEVLPGPPPGPQRAEGEKTGREKEHLGKLGPEP